MVPWVCPSSTVPHSAQFPKGGKLERILEEEKQLPIPFKYDFMIQRIPTFGSAQK